jgi:hypothetical protein
MGEKSNALLAVGDIPYSERGSEASPPDGGGKRDEPLKDLANSEPELEAAAAAIRNPANEELEGAAATETNLRAKR